MTVHRRVNKDAPADGKEYVRQDGAWVESSGGGGGAAPSNPLQSGFDSRADNTLSFVNGTRTFSISPTGAEFDIYQKGVKYTITGTESLVIDDLEGLHFIYFDAGVLNVTQTFTEAIITEYVFACAVHWSVSNAEAIIIADERHGREMDSATHVYHHNTEGAKYGDGLGLNNITADGNGTSDTHVQFGVASGSMWDEDIHHVITAGAPQNLVVPAEIPVLYRTGGAGSWNKTPATTIPVVSTGTGRLAYNEYTGVTWQQTEVTNNNFALMHYFATNDIYTPIMGIMGVEEYSNIAAARQGAYVEIATLTFGDMSPLTLEYVPLATVIFQTSNSYTNSVKSRIRITDTGDNYIDWREQTVIGGAGGGTGGTDPDAIHKSVAGEINSIPAKGTPTNSDVLIIEDAAATFIKAAITIGDLPYSAPGHTHTESDITDLTHYTHPATHPWSILVSTPTTLSGYGISDTQANFNTALSDGDFSFVGHTHTISQITDFTDNSANWDTAYGWGNHASASYLTDAPSDGTTYGRNNGAWVAAGGGGSVAFDDLTGKTSGTGDYRTSGEWQSTNANALRMVSGNYGVFWRFDGSNMYLMNTASGDQYGSWNTNRPLVFAPSTGAVSLGYGSTSGVIATTSTGVSVKGGVTLDHTSTYPATNLAYTGMVEKFIAGATVTAGYAVGLQTDTARGEVIHTDADVKGYPVGVAINGGAAGAVINVLTKGFIRLTGAQLSGGSNATIYLSRTPGYMSSLPVTAAGDYSMIMGYSPTTAILYVNPQMNWVKL